jgi:hypothetical protein
LHRVADIHRGVPAERGSVHHQLLRLHPSLQFEAAFGAERTADMRALLHAVAATDLGTTAVTVAE